MLRVNKLEMGLLKRDKDNNSIIQIINKSKQNKSNIEISKINDTN